MYKNGISMLSSTNLCWFVVTTVQGQYINVIYRPSVYSLCDNVAQNSILELGFDCSWLFWIMILSGLGMLHVCRVVANFVWKHKHCI